MLSQLRKPFKRQDSIHAPIDTTPSLKNSPGSKDDEEEEEHELSGVGLDKKVPLERNNDAHYHERKAIDPSALGVDELDPANLLSNGQERPIETAVDFSTRLIATVDDVNMPIHTLRMYVLGLGLTSFAAVLGQIFYFRPSSLTVSSLFIVVIADMLGRLWYMLFNALERLTQRFFPTEYRRPIWTFINPCEFNLKEHTATLIMSTTAFSSAQAISVFAADELYYDLNPNYGISIFTLIASQFLGYGIAGLMRAVVVYPSYAVWPATIPTVQLFQLLHNDKDIAGQRKRMKFFLLVALGIFIWEWFPEFIAPTLTGVSIFCLAKRDSVWVTRIFGGSYPNEGMALFSVCLDWAYLSGASSLYTPLATQMSLYAGVAVSATLLLTAYAGNVWQAQNFPFMAQDLFYENGSSYDQSLILNADYSLNRTLLEEQGLPWFATSMAIYYLGLNLSIGATITHCLLWYWEPVKEAATAFRSRSTDDAHYRKMLEYKEVPMWAYGAIVVSSFAMAMATCYTGHSHLPWYGVIVAFIIAIVLFPFVSIFPAITGWQVSIQTLVLMLGSAVVPGNAQANMYFGLYGSNAATQGIAFASDLKIAQYTKLPPRTTLWVQSLGTVLGGILQIVISKQIIGSHRDILLDPAGNNIWSGQNVQSFNSQAVTWGALAKDMYSPGSTYDMIPLSVLVGFGVPIIPWIIHRYYPKLRMDLFITPLFCYTLGYLAAGINSTIFMSVVTALLTQGYLRIYRPTWFRKYNYIMSAALDAGMQVFVFITTFALFGAGNGTTVAMPNWALNPVNYADYCYLDDSS